MSAMGWESMFRAMRGDDRRSALEALLAVMEEDAAGGGEEAPCCPRCGCPRVVRRGRDADGAQRWLCRGCGRTFRGTTGSVLASSKLEAPTWAEYAALMVSGATLRDCAAACGVSLRTSFSMRHRLLEVMERSLPAFEAGPGCPAQVDETLVPDSLSGNHSRGGAPMPRPARGRGGDGARAGVSRDKVSVVVAANPRGGVFLQEACLGKLGAGDARRAMAGCALEGAVVSTDRQKGYVRALREMGAAAHLRFASGGARAPLNLVNSVHSALKAFLARFRGVSTRRLHGYLMWFKWQREARRLGDLPGAIREHMSAARYRLSWRERVAEPYPFHPEMSVSIQG